MATPASGTSAQDSTLFLRKATGLVRSWSVFDAFVYAFFSINLVTLGMYSFSQMYYFEGGLLPTLLVSAFFLIFEIIVYASLISVMPRARAMGCSASTRRRCLPAVPSAATSPATPPALRALAPEP